MSIIKTTTDLSAAFSIKLAESGLSETDAKTMRLSTMLSDQTKKGGFLPFASFKIPYFNLDGTLSKFFRLRYLEDTRTGFALKTNVKPQRYVQPTKSENEVYLPPFMDWREIADNPSVPLIITEGELKAACATLNGWPAIGLGGVWMFRSARLNQPILPQLVVFIWDQRVVYILYDSDAATNHHVVGAECALAHELSQLGADVRIGRLPANEDGSKVGLDDFIVNHGIETLSEVLDEAVVYEESRALHELNRDVIYVQDPGIVYAVERRQRMNPNAFKEHHYANRFYSKKVIQADGTVKMERRATAADWLKWPHRSEVLTLSYEPGQDDITRDGTLNTWPGMLTAPEEGDVSLWTRLLDHLFLSSEVAERRWFEQWCAYPIQNLGVKMASASVFWGKTHGSGKTLVGHTLMRLYGKNAIEIHDTELRDDRNEWAENKQFALADDITGSSNRELANRLKTLITQKTVRLNPKYIPSYSVRDCINYYFTANDPDAFYLEMDDRRYFIHEVRAGKIEKRLRREFVEWRDSDDGIAALYAHLLQVDLRGFDPQDEAMVTGAKRDMIEVVRSDLGSWVAALSEGEELRINGQLLKRELWTSAELLTLYDPGGMKKVTAQGIARELRRAGYRLLPQVKVKGQPLRFFALRRSVYWEGRPAKDVAAHYEATTGKDGGRKF